MSGARRPCRVPLPRSWPSHVRSAIVQTVSLARTSLALTRGWASNSMNPHLRRQAEVDRLGVCPSNPQTGVFGGA